jgi:hypothetical protein
VVRALEGTDHAWLAEVLRVFNRGDLDAYVQLLPRLLAQVRTSLLLPVCVCFCWRSVLT